MANWIELRDRWLNGDAEALKQLCEEIRRVAYKTACRRFPNQVDPDDVAQDTTVKVIRHLPKFDRQAGFVAYVSKAAYTVSRDKIRPRIRHPEEPLASVGEAGLVDPKPNPEKLLLGQEEKAELLRAYLAPLEERERQVVKLHLAGDKNEEIAARLRISYTTVAGILHKAKRELQRCLLQKQGLVPRS